MARIFFIPSGIFTQEAFVTQLESNGHEVLLPNLEERTIDQFLRRFSEIGDADLVAAFNHHYVDEIDVIGLARGVKAMSPNCHVVLVVSGITETMETEARALGVKIISEHNLWAGTLMSAIQEALK